MTLIVGIDPGENGGIAFLTKYRKLTTKTLHGLTDHDKASLIKALNASDTEVFMEKVHGMPGCQGQFGFGEGFGFIKGCLVTNGLPTILVPPQKWMMGVSMGNLKMSKKDRKNALKARAQSLYPDNKITLATADAVLIAEYGWRQVYASK